MLLFENICSYCKTQNLTHSSLDKTNSKSLLKGPYNDKSKHAASWAVRTGTNGLEILFPGMGESTSSWADMQQPDQLYNLFLQRGEENSKAEEDWGKKSFRGLIQK